MKYIKLFEDVNSKESKWLRFENVPNDGKKTLIYNVVAKEGDQLLGVVKWHGPWRQYVFCPKPDTIFEKTCLRDITDFIMSLMNDRKIK